MSLNLRQIEIFRAVMTTGSISGASQLLFVSQPAVSRLLSHTEQRVGFALFERIKGRLYATPEAKNFFMKLKRFTKPYSASMFWLLTWQKTVRAF